MQRHQFERERHRKLIDKRDKVEAIIHSLREQNVDEEQIKEVEDILSPIEKEQIQKLDAAFRKYKISILLFIVNFLFFFCQNRSCSAATYRNNSSTGNVFINIEQCYTSTEKNWWQSCC
jgi:hypothetical protein